MSSKFFRRSDDSERVGGGWSRRSRKGSRRILIIIGIVAAVAILGLIIARPARNMIHGWQARRHARTAFALIDAQKWKEAREETTAAYQLSPNEPEAVRAIARFLSRQGDSGGLKFWKMLAEKTTLTRTDLRDEAAVALKARELDQARDAINRLLGGSPGEAQPADWLLAAQLAIQEKEFDSAYNELNKIFASNDASNEQQVQAVSLLETISRFRNGTLDPVVVRRLAKLAQGQDNASLEALTILAYRHLGAKSTTVSSDDLSDDDLVRLLQAHPLAQPFHQLTATNLMIQSRPSEREQIVKETIDRWKGGDNASLTALAAWLNSQKEYQRVLDLISENRALQTRELFVQYVDALGKLGRWTDIRRLIESEQFPLDPVIEHMYLAECLSQQGETNAADNNWNRALQEAAGDVNKLMMLGDYAEKHSANDTAMLAYEAVLGISPRLRAAQQGRLRVASNEQDTLKIHAILTEILHTWPNDPTAQSDDALIRLLRLPASGGDRTEIESIEKTARALIRREPESLSHRTVLALAYLREGHPADAMSVYADYKGADFNVTPAALAVHSAVLAANNRVLEGRKEAATIPEKDLLPEERLLTKF